MSINNVHECVCVLGADMVARRWGLEVGSLVRDKAAEITYHQMKK